MYYPLWLSKELCKVLNLQQLDVSESESRVKESEFSDYMMVHEHNQADKLIWQSMCKDGCCDCCFSYGDDCCQCGVSHADIPVGIAASAIPSAQSM